VTNAGAVWVLSAEGLFQVEKDRMSSVAVPAADGARDRAVSADGAEFVVASVVDDDSVGIITSHDAGATWSSGTTIKVHTNSGIGAVRVAVRGKTIVVLAIEATSSNTSQGQVAASTDGGQTWDIHRAPAGGDVIAAGGAFWFAGGLGGDEVARSKDGLDWTDVAVPVNSDAWSTSLPGDLGSGSIAVATTSHGGDASDVAFWTSSDGGATWRASGSVGAPPTEIGVTVPTVIRSDGSWTAIWPDGSKVVNGQLGDRGEPTVISPNGLPRNVLAIGSVESTLVALAATDDCSGGKSACTSTEMVLSSPDDGQTWALLP
jgi:hypothetical protein